jgi:hypothetical protein
MSESFDIIADMSDRAIKSKVMAQVGAFQGEWRIEAKRYRPRRTDRQNRYYWPCFVNAFGEYLREQGNDLSNDQAHEILKAKFLRVAVVDQQTGERFVFVRSTTTLNTVEFNEYLDKCAATLAEIGITVPDPTFYRETKEEPVHAATAAGK